MNPGESYRLSKSKFMNGIQCLRLLYKVVKMPEDIPPPDAATQFIFKQGNEVGALARERFPGGILIKMFPWDTILDRTRNAIDLKAEHIYEATFSHENVFVMVDVLKRVENDLFDIIEVKQSTRLKKEHIPDMAIQRYVVQGAGLRVNRTYLMHLNTDHIYPDDGELFILEDCTDEVDEHVRRRVVALRDHERGVVAQGHGHTPRGELLQDPTSWDEVGLLQGNQLVEIVHSGFDLAKQLEENWYLDRACLSEDQVSVDIHRLSRRQILDGETHDTIKLFDDLRHTTLQVLPEDVLGSLLCGGAARAHGYDD